MNTQAKNKVKRQKDLELERKKKIYILRKPPVYQIQGRNPPSLAILKARSIPLSRLRSFLAVFLLNLALLKARNVPLR